MHPRELYAWIDVNHDGTSISLSCQALDMHREGDYGWKPVPADRSRYGTVSALTEARKQHPCYDVRGLREAVDPALRPSYEKCYRLCKENGLLQRKKRPNGLTKCSHRDPQSDDLVQRDFTATVSGIKYLSDITQINADGKLYLAAMLERVHPKICVNATLTVRNKAKFYRDGSRLNGPPSCQQDNA